MGVAAETPQLGALKLLDQMRVIQGGNTLRISLGSQRILAILALNADARETRKRIALLLWENAEQSAALRNLRQALYELRKELGPLGDCLVQTPTDVSLAPEISVDLMIAHDRLGQAVIPDNLLSARPIAERISTALPPGNQTFESWVRLAVKEWEKKIDRALEEILYSDNSANKRRAADVLLNQDPSNELAARVLISAHALAGNTGSALSIYRRLWDHLDDEYGMEPSLETQELVARIKTDEPAPPPSHTNLPPQQCSIRVCAIQTADAAGDAGGDAVRVADLFRKELIACLSSFREFDIFDGQVHTGPADYEVSFVMVSQGAQINIAAHLTQSLDGSVVLAHRLEDITTRWFADQTDVTGRIAAACSAAVSRKRLQQIARAPTHSKVGDFWIKGQTKLLKVRPDAWMQAQELYETCIRLDPGFSPARSALAQLIHSRHLALPGIRPDPHILHKAQALANDAVDLDPQDSRAHLARAWNNCLLENFPQAMFSFDMALRCNPNDLWVLLSSALGAAFCDERDIAAELSRKSRSEAWSLMPVHWGFLATVDFVLEDFEACIASAGLAGQAIINLPAWKAAALARLGRPMPAAEAWTEFATAARAAWVPMEPATEEEIHRWLTSCFPFANPARRADFCHATRQAARLSE